MSSPKRRNEGERFAGAKRNSENYERLGGGVEILKYPEESPNEGYRVFATQPAFREAKRLFK